MRLVLAAAGVLAIFVLGADRATPSLGHAVVSFVPCRAEGASPPGSAATSIHLGLADFSAPYYDYQRIFKYRAVLEPPQPIDLAFDAPTGTYEMYVSVSGMMCTSQTYVTLLAGHTVHLNRAGISGTEDALPVATAAGVLPPDARASIVDLPTDVPCGTHVFGPLPSLSEYGSIQGDAYYVMVPYVPGSTVHTAPGLKLAFSNGSIYVRLPLRFDRQAKIINGAPTFARYDITPVRLAGFSALATPIGGPIMCPEDDADATNSGS